MKSSCASLFSTCAVIAFAAEAFPGGNLPVVVHIVAVEVVETFVMAVMEDTGIVAHPPGMFLVNALVARTPGSPAGRAEVAGKLAVVAGCLEGQDQKCLYP